MAQPVSFTIKPKFESKEADAAAKKLSKELKEQDKLVKAMDKSFDHVAKTVPHAMQNAERAISSMGRAMKGAFDHAMSGLDKFNSGIDKLQSKVFSLKTAIAGLAAVKLGGAILGEAKAEAGARARIRREFGDEATSLERLAEGSARRSGLDKAQTLTALATIAEATSTTQAGTIFRGKKLTAKQAMAVRQQTTKVGLDLFERISALNPDLAENPEELARTIASAGSGPEGMRMLVSQMRLNPALSKPLVEAAEKGRLYDVLTPAERQRFGVTKGQKGYEGGTMLEVLLARRGLTSAAADAARNRMSFQMRAVKSMAADDAAMAGEKALEKLQGVTGGQNLMDRYEQARNFAKEHATGIEIAGASYLGLRTIGGIKGLFKGGGGPASALEEATGGILGGKDVTPVRVVNWGEMSGPGGVGSKLESMASSGGGIVGLLKKVSAVVAAGAAGYAVGTFLDKELSLSDRISGTGGDRIKTATERKEGTFVDQIRREVSTAKSLQGMMASGALSGDQAAAQFLGFARAAEGGTDSSGLSKHLATLLRSGKSLPLEYLQRPEDIENMGRLHAKDAGPAGININVNASVAHDVPGFVASIMPAIQRQLTEAIQRATANGAAPTGRGR